MAQRAIDPNLGVENANSFHHDLHKDLKADYVLANPPFKIGVASVSAKDARVPQVSGNALGSLGKRRYEHK